MQEIVVISDVHVARFWNLVKKVYPGKFVNPNENFREFLKGVLDDQLLVINGDLVDYFYADRKGEQDNWELFQDLLSARKGETFLTLGNHDYRKRPYNVALFGLGYIGIPRDKMKQYKKVLSHTEFLGLKELDCVRVNRGRFNPLKNYDSPRYYARTLKGRELVFLDTGPDAFTRFRYWLRWPLIFSKHTAAEGLDQKQLDLVKQRLAAPGPKDVVVFMHAPPFAARRSMGSVRLGWFLYGWRLFSQGLNYGTFIHNNWQFIKLLIESEKNVTIIGSHTHTAKQYILDKRSNVVRQSDLEEINTLKDDERFVKVLTTLPMGTIKSHGRKTGYMVLGDKISYHVMHDYGKDL